jgi:hypothetical protein
MTNKCIEGQKIWDSRQDLPSGRKRAARLAMWQEHLSKCAQCQRWNAEQWQLTAAAPIIPFDLEEAK